LSFDVFPLFATKTSSEDNRDDFMFPPFTLLILSVVNNPSNVNYTRRNIITKGCIVKTEKGDVKITSRPGQTGTLQGIFV
jgi:hypothetical protein